MIAVCQYSYLLSHDLFPSRYNKTSITLANWQGLPGQNISFEQLSVIVLADAIDSIAGYLAPGLAQILDMEAKRVNVVLTV